MHVLRNFIFFAILAIAFASGCAGIPNRGDGNKPSLLWGAPLPPDVNKIVPPSPDIDPALACFSGIWQGTWWVSRGYFIDHILAVEEVDPSGVLIIYAWGQFYNPGYPPVGQPGWRYLTARYVNGELKTELPLKAVVTYRMNPNGTISAYYENPSVTAKATLVKVSGEEETRCKP